MKKDKLNEDKEAKKLIREQYKETKQYIRKRFILEPMLKKKKKELGRPLTPIEKEEVFIEAKKEVKRRDEKKGI